MARGIMWEVPYATSVGKHVGDVLIDATRRGAGEEKVSCWDLSSAEEYLLLEWEWDGRKLSVIAGEQGEFIGRLFRGTRGP